MVTIRAPGVLAPDSLAAHNSLTAAVETKALPVDKTEGFCPRCGMQYRYIDGVLYPQRHEDGHSHAYSAQSHDGEGHGLDQSVRHKDTSCREDRICDACHLEEAMSNIRARRALNAIVHRTITQPSLKRQILIPERKQRLINSVSETIGGFALSRQEIGNVIDLCGDVEMATTLLEDAASIKENCDYTVDELKAVLAGAHQRLSDYIANLDDRKRHDLYSMMLLGRNLDYYGLCQEAVVEFKLRAHDCPSHEASAGIYHSAERIAGKRDLKNWLLLVLDLVEG